MATEVKIIVCKFSFQNKFTLLIGPTYIYKYSFYGVDNLRSPQYNQESQLQAVPCSTLVN